MYPETEKELTWAVSLGTGDWKGFQGRTCKSNTEQVIPLCSIIAQKRTHPII